MNIKQKLERIKVLANVAYEDRCEVSLETYEDGHADMREEGTSAFVVLVRNRSGLGDRIVSELCEDPEQGAEDMLKRLEVVAVAKLRSKHDELARNRKKVAAAFAKIQYEYHDSMIAMAERFEKLNTPIERIKRDDIYRCNLNRSPSIDALVKKCPFIGFGAVKRNGTNSACVARVSGILRYWYSSRPEVPVARMPSARDTVAWFDKEDTVDDLVTFLGLCHRAWSSSPEYSSLWNPFNMTLCMWLYRRICLEVTSKGLQVTNELFYLCLLSLTGNRDYLAWLAAAHGGRSMNRDRNEGYRRITDSFRRTIQDSLGGKKCFLPVPTWMQHGTVKAA